MKTSTILIAAFIIETLLITNCGGEKKDESATTTSATTSDSNDLPADQMRLRGQSGGYVRGPSRDRVIVFINGVFGDAVSTWQASNGSYWPALMASDAAFSDADIYVHSFDSPKLTTAQSIDELAGRMRDYLQRDGVFEKHRQVIFLCHSMGGLITRAFLLKLRPSPEKVPMIYFFATPTTGANVAEITGIVSDNPQLQSMLPLREDGYVGDLQNAWLVTSDDSNLNYPARIASFCAYEKKNTFGIRVVERQSATNLCNRETRGIVADHLDIVKPDNAQSSDSYVFFKVAYDRTVGPSSVAIERALMSAATPPDANFVRTTAVPLTQSVSADRLMIKKSRLKTTSIRVGCGETKESEIVATIDLEPGEEIIAVRPEIRNPTNISQSSVALVQHADNKATIRYSISGLKAVEGRVVGGAALRERELLTSTARLRSGAAAARSMEVAPDVATLTRGEAIDRRLAAEVSLRPEVTVNIRQLRILRPSVAVSNCPGSGQAEVVVSFVVRGSSQDPPG